MKVLSLFTTTCILSIVGITAKKETGEYVYGKDPKKDAGKLFPFRS